MAFTKREIDAARVSYRQVREQMYKYILAIGAVVIALFFGVSRGNAVDVYPVDKTPVNVPLTLQVDTVDYNGRTLKVWGTVTNRSSTPYRSVRVAFAVKASDGAFVVRESFPVSPDVIEPWGTGTMNESRLDCGRDTPDTLEYQLSGQPVKE